MPVAADYLLENPDVARAYKASGSKLTPEQYAYEHYKNYGQAENRSWGMAAPTGKTAQDYYNANPDVWREYNKSGAGSSVQDFATTHWNRYGQDENRSWEMPDPADKTAFTLDDVVPYASPARPAPGPGFTPPEMSEFALAKPTTVADSDVDIDSYVPEATATVAGQMESLMDKNSPYLQQAAKAGERTAQARGLLSSSMAAGAAQGAAMDRALPIAQQDAQTYATNALTVLQGKIQSDLSYQDTVQSDYINQRNLTLQGMISSGISAQEAEQNLQQTEYQGMINAGLSDRQAQDKLQQIQLQQFNENYRAELEQSMDTARLASADREAASTAMTNYGFQFQKDVAAIQQDPNTSGEEKTAKMEVARKVYESNMQNTAALYAIDLTWSTPF